MDADSYSFMRSYASMPIHNDHVEKQSKIE